MSNIVTLDQFRNASAKKTVARTGMGDDALAAPVVSSTPSLFTPAGYAAAAGFDDGPESVGYAVAQKHLEVTRALNPGFTARDLRLELESDVAFWKPRLDLVRHLSLDYLYSQKNCFDGVDAVVALTGGFNYFATSARDSWPNVKSRAAYIRHGLCNKTIDVFAQKHTVLSPVSRCAYIVRTHLALSDMIGELARPSPIRPEDFEMMTAEYAPLMDRPDITANWGQSRLVKSMRGEIAKLNQWRRRLSPPTITPVR